MKQKVKEARLLKDIKETPEQRHARVVAEAGRFRSRKETPKNWYNRKKSKAESRRAFKDF